MDEFITAGQGDFFTQDNPASAFEVLTCTGVGDLPLPMGDLTPQYCPDPAQKGKFKVAGFIQGEAGAATTTLTRPLSNVANWLLEQAEMGCYFNGWVPYGCGGERGNPENWDVGVLLYGMRISNSRILASAVAMQPSDESRVMTDAEITYQGRMMMYKVRFDQQGVDNTANANAIAFLPMRCEDRCGPARNSCTEGYIALAGSLYDSEVKYTRDAGANWYEVATHPFVFGGVASDVVPIEVSGGHRAIFSRGSAVAGVHAEVSIYENWLKVKDVYVGTVDNQVINALYNYAGKTWAAASGGYIYRSDNSGDSWSASEAGNETTEDLNDIIMVSSTKGFAVGDNNTVLAVTDGTDWNAETGPAANTDLLSMAANHAGHVFVGGADGTLYVSEDDCQTWEDDREMDFGNGSIVHIEFPDKTLKYAGYLIFNDANGVGWVYRTKDGGVSWQTAGMQLANWNSGLNGGFMCDQNRIFVVGNAHNGTTFIAKTTVVGG